MKLLIGDKSEEEVIRLSLKQYSYDGSIVLQARDKETVKNFIEFYPDGKVILSAQAELKYGNFKFDEFGRLEVE